MAKQKITEKTERKISAALADVAHFVESEGCSPESALIKAAKDADLTAGQVRLMVHAYNNGRTLQHIQGSDEYEQKTAEFPLAKLSVVLDGVFPSEVKTAAQTHSETTVSPEYAGRPRWVGRRKEAAILQKSADVTKTASARKSRPRLRHVIVNDLLNERSALQKELKTRQQQLRGLKFKAAQAIDTAAEFFWKNAATVSFDAVYDNVAVMHGKAGTCLMDRIRRQCEPVLKKYAREKTAADYRMDPAAPQYALVTAALDAACRYGNAKDSLKEFQKNAEEAVKNINHALGIHKKKAGMFDFLQFGAANAAFKSLKKLPQAFEDTASQVQKKWEGAVSDGLASPEHDATLRNIRVKTLLGELLGEDEVLQAYNPDEVLSAYNELSEMAPVAMANKALVRPYLRKYLEQSRVLDPYDLDQLTKTEMTLRGQMAPAATAPAAPPK